MADPPMRRLDWSALTWRNEPPHVAIEADTMVVETAAETDFWRITSYGFVHDDGHVLGLPLDGDAAIEIDFAADYSAPFDQAGVMLRAGPETWLKAGVELSDGRLWASVVVTGGRSDWSLAPLPDDIGTEVLTVRASRQGDAVTVRLRSGPEADWQLLRVAPMPSDAVLEAGPMCCSPSRAGLRVRFGSVRVGPPDARLHGD